MGSHRHQDSVVPAVMVELENEVLLITPTDVTVLVKAHVQPVQQALRPHIGKGGEGGIPPPPEG